MKTNSLLYRVSCRLRRLKRGVLNRRGDGVHSPFAFQLIRQTFRNPHPFVAFEKLRAKQGEGLRALKADWGDSLITRPKVAELIFRLVHHWLAQPDVVTLIAPAVSILPEYLWATSKVAELVHSETCPPALSSLLVVEDIAQAELLPDLAPPLGAERMVIWHRHNPKLRSQLKHLRKQHKPQAVFTTLDLEVWVWRRSLTPGRYTIHY